MKTIEIPVLIVGGGPVGLCTSILLPQHGVPSLLVERHTGTSLYPKARLVNTRTMEIFRECGLEQVVREISLPPEQSHHAIWARTLVGEELQRHTFDTVTTNLSETVSPTVGSTTSQEVLEPVDHWITAQTLRNLASIRRLGSEEVSADAGMYEGRQEFFHEQGMIFAAAYESAVVLADGTALPEVANPVTEYVPTARPGCRAPHVWLGRAGQRLSTLDLFGTSFVLLTRQTGTAWCQAATEVTHARRLPLCAFTVGTQGDLIDPDGSWAITYGVEQDGAVLVRPDGHVAWRTRSSAPNPILVLQEVLASILGETVMGEMGNLTHTRNLLPSYTSKDES